MDKMSLHINQNLRNLNKQIKKKRMNYLSPFSKRVNEFSKSNALAELNKVHLSPHNRNTKSSATKIKDEQMKIFNSHSKKNIQIFTDFYRSNSTTKNLNETRDINANPSTRIRLIKNINSKIQVTNNMTYFNNKNSNSLSPKNHIGRNKRLINCKKKRKCETDEDLNELIINSDNFLSSKSVIRLNKANKKSFSNNNLIEKIKSHFNFTKYLQTEKITKLNNLKGSFNRRNSNKVKHDNLNTNNITRVNNVNFKSFLLKSVNSDGLANKKKSSNLYVSKINNMNKKKNNYNNAKINSKHLNKLLDVNMNTMKSPLRISNVDKVFEDKTNTKLINQETNTFSSYNSLGNITSNNSLKNTKNKFRHNKSINLKIYTGFKGFNNIFNTNGNIVTNQNCNIKPNANLYNKRNLKTNSNNIIISHGNINIFTSINNDNTTNPKACCKKYSSKNKFKQGTSANIEKKCRSKILESYDNINDNRETNAESNKETKEINKDCYDNYKSIKSRVGQTIDSFVSCDIQNSNAECPEEMHCFYIKVIQNQKNTENNFN